MLCTLLNLIFTVSACFAEITIPRNDGTMLPLNQISDIIRHVTGNLSSTDIFFPKNSLMLLRASKNGSNVVITPSIYTFYREGNTYGSFDVKSGAATNESISGLSWNYVPGVHSSALSTTTVDGKKTVLASLPISANNKQPLVIEIAVTPYFNYCYIRHMC